MFTLRLTRQRRYLGALAALVPLLQGFAATDDLYQTVTAGTRVTLSVTADGNPVPKFQWLKDGVKISGATNSTYVISSVSTSHAGVYNALATNSVGWALSNDCILTVKPAAVAPSFTVHPYPAASAPTGTSLTLTAQASGNPTPTYQWYKNGVAISGATKTTLSFTSLKTTDAATYWAVAKNSAGTATSNKSVVSVTAAVAPAFSAQPQDMTASVGSTVALRVTVTGTPTPVLQWYKNGVAISGATSQYLILSNVTTAHSGTYVAIARNSAGAAMTKGAVLTVK